MCCAHGVQARLDDGESCVRLSALEAVSQLEPPVRALALALALAPAPAFPSLA